MAICIPHLPCIAHLDTIPLKNIMAVVHTVEAGVHWYAHYLVVVHHHVLAEHSAEACGQQVVMNDATHQSSTECIIIRTNGRMPCQHRHGIHGGYGELQ